MRQILFKSKNFDVVSEPLSSPLGVEEQTEYVWQPDVVIAVPVHNNGNVTLVRHARPILRQELLECPGGKVDPGEDLEQAITRELEEEVGFTPHHLEYVTHFFSSVGTSTEKIHVFIARNLAPHTRNAADAKRMNLVELSPEDLLRTFNSNELHDGKTIVALAAYLRIARLHGSASSPG